MLYEIASNFGPFIEMTVSLSVLFSAAYFCFGESA